MPSQRPKKRVTSRTKAAKKRRPLRGEIARRADEIFLGRGGGDGHDVEDWLQAEAELAGRHR